VGWTIVPTFILTLITIPSFILLYAFERIIDPVVTVKAIGHQWYWCYEFNDPRFKEGVRIREAPRRSLDKIRHKYEGRGQVGLRLLETTRRLFLPTECHIRLLVSSADVLHSWAVPSLGIKMDACPGRLNQVTFFIKRAGVFYGQCSEICGVNHGFRPITVQAAPTAEWFASVWRCYQKDRVLNVEGGGAELQVAR
jgi:cytochrome c oxidase subunit 2